MRIILKIQKITQRRRKYPKIHFLRKSENRFCKENLLAAIEEVVDESKVEKDEEIVQETVRATETERKAEKSCEKKVMSETPSVQVCEKRDQISSSCREIRSKEILQCCPVDVQKEVLEKVKALELKRKGKNGFCGLMSSRIAGASISDGAFNHRNIIVV